MKPKLIPSEILEKRVALLDALLGPGWVASALGDPGADARSFEFDRIATWREMELVYSRLAAWLIRGLDWLCRCGRGMGDFPSQDAEKPVGAASGGIGCATRLIPTLRSGMDLKPAGVAITCRITPYDFLQCIVPALASLYCLHDRLLGSEADENRPVRCVIGLAGVPGGGKSVLASILEAFSGLPDSWPAIQAVGIDGWHLPNQVLAQKEITDESGRKVRLTDRKGCPESYDIQSLAQALARLARDPSPLRLPVYDRSRHEPVPEAIEITAPIVLVEGNYVLMRCRGWDAVAAQRHFGIWLDVSCRLARRRMMRRDVSVGRSAVQASMKWRRNDWPNSLAAITGRENAEAVIYAAGQRGLVFAHRVLESNFR